MNMTAISKSGFIIRLPKERWQHIIARHSALTNQQSLVLATITEPEIILDGNEGALMAIRTLEIGRVLVVVYKETSNNDSFVITAFPTRRLNSLTRRIQLWP
jgi:hypothetical protein